MGVIDVYFVDNGVEDCCRQKVVDFAFDFSQSYPLSSGARPVLPMRVAPEAIAENFRV
jgi:hypothetical protein